MDPMSIIRTAAATFAWTTKAENLPENVREGVFKISIGHDINEWIKCGVEVSDPKEDRDDNIWARAVVFATYCHRQVPSEEWKPADQKGPHDEAETEGSFGLLAEGRGHHPPLPLTDNYNVHVSSPTLCLSKEKILHGRSRPSFQLDGLHVDPAVLSAGWRSDGETHLI